MAWPPFAPVAKLFVVVDDSPGMLGAQARLADAMGIFAERMDERGLDYLVAVTGTGAYAPDGACDGSGGGVGLGVASCRTRLGAFVDGPGAPADPAAVCTDRCDLASLATNDGAPYLASRSGALNVDANASAAEVLRCMVPVGNDGCPFVQPLEAALAAFSGDAFSGEASPTRDGSRGLVVVTDGTECSVQDGTIFDPAGNRVFWSDPAAAEPTQAVCWNAGVSCEGGQNGTYDVCEPADRTADGAVAGGSASAVLTPVGALASRLDDLLDSPLGGGHTRVLGIAGVPDGYPDVPIPYEDAADPQVQDTYGIGPGCEASDLVAPPPVRLAAALGRVAAQGETVLSSLCAGTYDAAIAELADDLAERALKQTCRDLGPSMVGADAADIRSLCWATHVRVDEQGQFTESPLPFCDDGPDGPAVPEGEGACVYVVTGAEAGAMCGDDPNLAMVMVRTLRRPTYEYRWIDRVTIDCAGQEPEDACTP